MIIYSDKDNSYIIIKIIMSEYCGHFTGEDLKTAKAYECEECVKTGDTWVHLRTCQTCGATLCCDNSPNRHMTKHANEMGHPVVISSEPDEYWAYCYPDDMFMRYR